jgi:hypothetical protein
MTRSRELAELASAYDSGSALGFRNRIINGDMRIDQRNAGASVTQNNTGPYTVDRWLAYGTQNSKFTVQQNAASVTPPVGFSNYLGCTSSSAYTVGASETFVIAQKIEGYNVADLAWGTANAASVTLSFWVRSSLTGTFGGSLQNSANTRSYPFSYTINSANTWEQKNIVIAGDTTGTWVVNTGNGLQVNFSLGTGTSASATSGVWAGAAYFSATGATSVVGTSGATFYITGVQLEAGSVATPFERRDYGRELIMCQRYFFRYSTTSAYGPYGTGHGVNTTQARFCIKTPQTMRAQPSLSFSTASGFLVGYLNSLSSISAAEFGVDNFSCDGFSTGLTAFGSYMLTSNNNTTSFMTASAEL